MELEQPSVEFKPVSDRRPHMPEPPPVWLIAIEDVHVPVAAGLEVQLDDFYVTMLRFEREIDPKAGLCYKAENFRLCCDVLEPPIQRPDFRPVAIDVPSLALVQQQLVEREIEYEWQRGLSVGRDTLVLKDPAGNWVALTERRAVA